MTDNTPEAGIEELKNRLVRAGSLDPEERVLNIQYDDVIAWHRTTLHQARHDWLREEIVKLEGMKKPTDFKLEKDKTYNPHELVDYMNDCAGHLGYNKALQTIIDRYQAELDQTKK